MNDVVVRHCESGRYLFGVYFEQTGSLIPLSFVSKASVALVFENEELAQATIDFISNVIDFETAECLEIVIVP